MHNNSFLHEHVYIEIMYEVSSSNDSNSTVRFYFFLHYNQVIEKLQITFKFYAQVLKFFCNFYPKFTPYTYNYVNTNFKSNINTYSQKEYIYVRTCRYMGGSC